MTASTASHESSLPVARQCTSQVCCSRVALRRRSAAHACRPLHVGIAACSVVALSRALRSAAAVRAREPNPPPLTGCVAFKRAAAFKPHSTPHSADGSTNTSRLLSPRSAAAAAAAASVALSTRSVCPVLLALALWRLLPLLRAVLPAWRLSQPAVAAPHSEAATSAPDGHSDRSAPPATAMPSCCRSRCVLC